MQENQPETTAVAQSGGARCSAAGRRLIIAACRARQPLAELRRKANKARNRANIWTIEELDLAAAEARRMADALGW